MFAKRCEPSRRNPSALTTAEVLFFQFQLLFSAHLRVGRDSVGFADAFLAGGGADAERVGGTPLGVPQYLQEETNLNLKSYPQANALKDFKVKNARARVTVFERLKEEPERGLWVNDRPKMRVNDRPKI